MKKIRIKTALVSVSDKTNLIKLASYFLDNNILVISSGGTFKYLKKLNPKLKLIEVSDYTKFNEILDGRVKTLHPIIHAGILADKNKAFFLKRFNPWGWATWKDRWKEFNPSIKFAIENLNILGKTNKLR